MNQVIPVRRRLNAGSDDRKVIPLDSEEVLGSPPRILPAVFSEVLVTDNAVGVNEVEGRPVMVVEGSPDLEVVVHGDRVFDWRSMALCTFSTSCSKENSGE